MASASWQSLWTLVQAIPPYDCRVAVDVETSIEIGRPRSVVAANVSDPDNATRWYVNIKSVEWMTPPPGPVMSAAIRRASQKDLARLKSILEAETDHEGTSG